MKLFLSFSALSAVVAFSFLPQSVQAHCQVPCGIFDDHARYHALLEDTVTIKKAMSKINASAGVTDAQSKNQSTRWILNKEKHADLIIKTISEYFLAQRVKPSMKDYKERLVKHHKVMLLAMKSKQSVDVSVADDLSAAIKELVAYYPGDH